MLDLLCGCLDHVRRAFDGLIFSAKFGWSWLSIILKMQVSMLSEFGLKMPLHALFRRVFGRKIGENKLFAVLLQRIALQALYTSYNNSVRPSIHPSVTRRYCVSK